MTKLLAKIFDTIKDFFDALFLGWEEGLKDPKTGEKLPGQVGMKDPIFGKNVKLYSVLVALILLIGYLLRKLF